MCSITELCFMCTNDKNCTLVDHKIVNLVEYLLPEITIFKLGIELQICNICEKYLNSFNQFKQIWVDNSNRLEAKLKQVQTRDIPDQTVGNTDAQPDVDTFKHESFYSDPQPDLDTLKHEIDQMDVDIKMDAQNTDSSDSEENSNIDPNLQNYLEIYIKEEPQENSDKKEEAPQTNSTNPTNTNTTTEKKKLQCPICSKLFNDRSNLRKHIIAHSGIKNCICPICNKLFARNSSLKTHMKIHSGIKDYQCTICNKQFTQNSHLKFHMKIHSGEREFQCSICTKTFNRSERLKKHMIVHTVNKAVECSVCKKLIQPNNIGKHLEAHSRIKNYQCQICQKTLTNSSNLSKHLKIHSGIKDYQCDICNKMFIRKDKLKIHMNVHNRMARNLNTALEIPGTHMLASNTVNLLLPDTTSQILNAEAEDVQCAPDLAIVKQEMQDSDDEGY